MLQIYSAWGQVVVAEEIQELSVGKSTILLDLRALPSGTYTLVLKADSAVEVARFQVL